MPEDLIVRAFVPSFVFGPTLRSALQALYGQSRETKVLQALLSASPITLSAISHLCSASERAIRNDGRAGWIRLILERYRDLGVVIERDKGNMIPLTARALAITIAVVDFPEPVAPRIQTCRVREETGISTGPPVLNDSSFDHPMVSESTIPNTGLTVCD